MALVIYNDHKIDWLMHELDVYLHTVTTTHTCSCVKPWQEHPENTGHMFRLLWSCVSKHSSSDLPW